jgi:hypothetical protein
MLCVKIKWCVKIRVRKEGERGSTQSRMGTWLTSACSGHHSPDRIEMGQWHTVLFSYRRRCVASACTMGGPFRLRLATTDLASHSGNADDFCYCGDPLSDALPPCVLQCLQPIFPGMLEDLKSGRTLGAEIANLAVGDQELE